MHDWEGALVLVVLVIVGVGAYSFFSCPTTNMNLPVFILFARNLDCRQVTNCLLSPV